MKQRTDAVRHALWLLTLSACTPVPALPLPGPQHPANPQAAVAETAPGSTTLSRPLRQAAEVQRPTGRGHR